MTAQPLVTVIMPCYNHEKYVAQAISSVIQQKYENLELIVFNDGSTDNTHKMILSKVDECKKRFSLFQYINKQNEGLSNTLNAGVRLARGSLISFLASDDLYLDNKFDILVSEKRYLDNKYAVVCGDAAFIDESGDPIHIDLNGRALKKQTSCNCSSFIKYHIQNRKDFDINSDFGSYKSFLYGNYLPAMATIIDREALLAVGMFAPTLSLEDYDLWFKLSKSYKFKYVDKCVAFYRWHQHNTIKTKVRNLTFDLGTILIREKRYCVLNGLRKDWELAFFRLLMRILKNRYLSLFFIQAFFMNMPSIIRAVVNKVFENKKTA